MNFSMVTSGTRVFVACSPPPSSAGGSGTFPKMFSDRSPALDPEYEPPEDRDHVDRPPSYFIDTTGLYDEKSSMIVDY